MFAFSRTKLRSLRKHNFLSIKKVIKEITPEDYQRVSAQLAHSPKEIRRVVELMSP